MGSRSSGLGRRRLLAAVGAAAVGSTAGCGALGGAQEFRTEPVLDKTANADPHVGWRFPVGESAAVDGEQWALLERASRYDDLDESGPAEVGYLLRAAEPRGVSLTSTFRIRPPRAWRASFGWPSFLVSGSRGARAYTDPIENGPGRDLVVEIDGSPVAPLVLTWEDGIPDELRVELTARVAEDRVYGREHVGTATASGTLPVATDDPLGGR